MVFSGPFRTFKISSFVGCALKRRRSALCWTQACRSAAQLSERGFIWLGEARTTGAAAAGAKLRKLAVCKTLAIIADPVQETCGDRGAVRIRAYSYERPSRPGVPISQRQRPRRDQRLKKQGMNAVAATI